MAAHRLQPSRFLRVLRNDELVALVHQLHPQPVFTSAALWTATMERLRCDELLGADQGLLEALRQRKLLVTSERENTLELDRVRHQARLALDRPTILYLMMVQGCDCACSYCPIPGLAIRHGQQSLSFENATAGIQLWARSIANHPADDQPYYLIFYGGEPLLNAEVVERLLPYIVAQRQARRLPENLKLMVCTNGLGLNHRLAALFRQYGVTVALGLDGPADWNDQSRRMVDGGPTYDGIVRAAQLLRTAGVNMVASTTITPANINGLDRMAPMMAELGISGFGFNLMKGRALVDAFGPDTTDYAQRAARGVLAGLTAGSVEPISEYQLTKYQSVLDQGLPFAVGCTCYGNQLVIQPDGQVTNCPFLRFDQGSVQAMPDDFRMSTTAVVKQWRQRIGLFSDHVMSDPHQVFLDSGGCAWGSAEHHGRIDAVDDTQATFTQEVMYALIWARLPAALASALRRNEATHWCDRRVGNLHAAEPEGV